MARNAVHNTEAAGRVANATGWKEGTDGGEKSSAMTLVALSMLLLPPPPMMLPNSSFSVSATAAAVKSINSWGCGFGCWGFADFNYWGFVVLLWLIDAANPQKVRLMQQGGWRKRSGAKARRR